MTHYTRQHRLALMLPLLSMLLAGCAGDSPLLQPAPAVVAPPIIPPLPQAARQPTPPPICSQGCSKGLQMLLDSLLEPPTNLASPGTPAPAPMTR